MTAAGGQMEGDAVPWGTSRAPAFQGACVAEGNMDPKTPGPQPPGRPQGGEENGTPRVASPESDLVQSRAAALTADWLIGEIFKDCSCGQCCSSTSPNVSASVEWPVGLDVTVPEDEETEAKEALCESSVTRVKSPPTCPTEDALGERQPREGALTSDGDVPLATGSLQEETPVKVVREDPALSPVTSSSATADTPPGADFASNTGGSDGVLTDPLESTSCAFKGRSPHLTASPERKSMGGTLVPSEDWELNLLLLKIARALEPDDFQAMKFLSSGQRGVPKAVLERLDTPQKFFTHLRERGMISRDNLLLLQSFLWHVERRDLHDMAAMFARRLGNTLYFFAPNVEPEPGSEHVTFHVEGTLGEFERRDLEALRHTAARLMFVPAEYVFLAGIEPSHSILVTFRVPSVAVAWLLEVKAAHGDLAALGVDALLARGQVLSLQGALPPSRQSPPEESMTATNAQPLAAVPLVVEAEGVPGMTSHRVGVASCREESDPLVELFLRACQLEQQAEQSEIRVLDTRERLGEAQQQAEAMRTKEEYFRGLLYRLVTSERRQSSRSVRDERRHLSPTKVII